MKLFSCFGSSSMISSSSSSNSKPTINSIKPAVLLCSKTNNKIKPAGELNPGENLKIFSCQELGIATHGFSSSNKIGEGAFGSVFKGRLGDGSIVAVKVLSIELESMRGEREFVSELAALSNIKHENLVDLQGCCVDGAKRYLVYDYMEKNSLAQTFLGKEENRMKFSWETRKGIASGVANGLAYLHEKANPQIVHRDIKASNILLDHNFRPKVADFGLSRLLTDKASHISTRVAGTLGYLAPEYAITGHLTRKSDVYSFGVVLLEIITGSPAVNFSLELGEHYLVQKAWQAYEDGKPLEIIDSTLNMNFPEEEALRFLMVSLLCLQKNAKLRPQMSTAVKMLNNEIEVRDLQISQPGIVSNLMDIRLNEKSSNSSDKCTSNSSQSSVYFF